MIVSLENFNNEAKIPDLFPEIGNNDLVNEITKKKVISFIEKYEPIYLFSYFGNKNSVKKIYEYNELPEDEKTDKMLNRLIEVFKTTISYYVAFHYFRDNTVWNTGVGATIPNRENSSKINNVERCCVIWNRMVDLNHVSKFFFRNSEFIDSSYCNSFSSEIFEEINIFGL